MDNRNLSSLRSHITELVYEQFDSLTSAERPSSTPNGVSY